MAKLVLRGPDCAGQPYTHQLDNSVSLPLQLTPPLLQQTWAEAETLGEVSRNLGH